MNASELDGRCLGGAWVLAFGFAVPAQAQVFRGGIDASILGPAGEPVPGARVDLTGRVAGAGGRSERAGALPEPARRHLHGQGIADELHGLHLQQRRGAQQCEHAARRASGVCLRRVRGDQREAHRPGLPTSPRHDDDARDRPGIAGRTQCPRSVGRAADGCRRSTSTVSTSAGRNRPSNPTTTPRARRAPTTRGASTASPSPTWVRAPRSRRSSPDRRRSSTTSTASRTWPSRPAAPTRRTRRGGRGRQPGAEEGARHAARIGARVLREPESRERQHLVRARHVARRYDGESAAASTSYHDYGAELGGPLLKDVVWIWGTFTWTGIDLLTATGLPDNTRFKNYALKADGKLNDKVRGNATFLREHQGEGLCRRRPRCVRVLTAWSQDDPTRVLQGRGHLRRRRPAVRLGERRLHFRRVRSHAGRRPAHGLLHRRCACPRTTRTTSTRARGPQHYYGGDASYFAGPHEIRFGGGMALDARSTRSRSGPPATSWRTGTAIRTCSSRPRATTARSTRAKYINAFVTDTISLGPLTVTGGIRFDRQSSSLGPASVAGVAGIAILPAPERAGRRLRVQLEQRDAARRASPWPSTRIARASCGRATRCTRRSCPGRKRRSSRRSSTPTRITTRWTATGDGVSQLSEILFNQGLQGYTGSIRATRRGLSSVNTVDPNVKAPITHEMLIGFDRELMPDFGRQRDLHLPAHGGSAVDSADWRHVVRLHADRHPVRHAPGNRLVQRAALRAQRVGGAARRRPDGDQSPRLSPALPGFRDQRGPSACRTGGWPRFAFIHQRVGASTSTNPSQSIPRSDALRRRPRRAGRSPAPQINGGVVLQASAGNGQSTIYMVAPSYQIAASGLFEVFWGMSIGGECRRASGICRAVLREQRRDRRSARAQDRAAGADGRTPSGCRA